jgi:hypothetical protein
MKPYPRIRKSVKWGGAVVCVVLALMWLASIRWDIAWGTDNTWRGIAYGRLQFSWDDHGFTTGSGVPQLWFSRNTPEIRWWFDWGNDGYHQHHFRVPLWVLMALMLMPTASAWRLDTLARRRARLNHCPACNYPRAGLPAASPCPECGAAPAPAAPAQPRTNP